MTLARRIADALVALFAYTMDPDAYLEGNGPEERRNAIRQGREAMEAAEVLTWIEEQMEEVGAKGRPHGVTISFEPEVPQFVAIAFVYMGRSRVGRGPGILEAISDLMRNPPPPA